MVIQELTADGALTLNFIATFTREGRYCLVIQRSKAFFLIRKKTALTVTVG
jgi:hypothetical protein